MPGAAPVLINGVSITVEPGTSLFDAAERAGIQVPTSCRSLGKCKECIVEVTAGADALSPPTWHERHLKPPFRLSCQARIEDASVSCHTMRRGRMRIERQALNLPRAGGTGRLEAAVTREGDRVLLDGQEIPSQIKASDDLDDVTLPLDGRFMERIDQQAAKRGLQGTDDYLAQWQWSEEQEREGTAEDVARAIKNELEAAADW